MDTGINSTSLAEFLKPLKTALTSWPDEYDGSLTVDLRRTDFVSSSPLAEVARATIAAVPKPPAAPTSQGATFENDYSAYLTARAKWKHFHDSSVATAKSLSAAVSVLGPTANHTPDLIGCISAGAQLLDQQHAQNQVLIFLSDLSLRGHQELDTRLDLSRVLVRMYSTCAQAQACSSLATVWGWFGGWSRAKQFEVLRVETAVDGIHKVLVGDAS